MADLRRLSSKKQNCPAFLLSFLGSTFLPLQCAQTVGPMLPTTATSPVPGPLTRTRRMRAPSRPWPTTSQRRLSRPSRSPRWPAPSSESPGDARGGEPGGGATSRPAQAAELAVHARENFATARLSNLPCRLLLLPIDPHSPVHHMVAHTPPFFILPRRCPTPLSPSPPCGAGQWPAWAPGRRGERVGRGSGVASVRLARRSHEAPARARQGHPERRAKS